MTNQPAPTPDDDPAAESADQVAEFLGRRYHFAFSAMDVRDCGVIVRGAYSVLIASVRELLGEIHGEKACRDVPLIQQIADASEVVRKERGESEERRQRIDFILTQFGDFKKAAFDPETGITWRTEAANLQRQLAAATERIHPWYGPCDAIAAGKCSECARLEGLQSGDDRLRDLRNQLAAANAENERLRLRVQGLEQAREIETVTWGAARSERDAAIMENAELRRQIAERDAPPPVPHQKYPTESEDRAYKQGLYDSRYRIQRNYGADHRRNSAHFDGLMQGARWEGVVEHLRQKTHPSKPPDQERVERTTFCGHAVCGDRGGPAEACGKQLPCADHPPVVRVDAFVADSPTAPPSELPITAATATCICGDPVHPSSVGVGLRHYSHGQYHLIEVRVEQEIEQQSEPEPDDPVEWLEDLIRQGSGAVILCMTENGDIGIFRDLADESAKALGDGDTIYDAADSAKRRAEAEPSSPQATAPQPSADEYYRLKIMKNGLTILIEQRRSEGAELATIDDMIREIDVMIGRNRCYPTGDRHSEKCDGRCGKGENPPQATAPVECPSCRHSSPHSLPMLAGKICADLRGDVRCACLAEFRDNALRAIDEAVRWATNDHHCKPPLGNPTREEAIEQVANLRGIIERLRALDASKLPCGCNARFALTIGGACTICEVERLRAKLTEAEREQAITAKVIQSQQEMIRKLTPCGPVNLQVREKAAIQVLRAARELTEDGAVEAWRTLGQYWRNHWLMKADRIIAILVGEQEGRS